MLYKLKGDLRISEYDTKINFIIQNTLRKKDSEPLNTLKITIHVHVL